MPSKKVKSLRDALEIHPKEIISLVGAGGKTALMFALARELATHKKVVITTTTTKIFPPAPSDTPFLFLSRDEEEIVAYIIKDASKRMKVVYDIMNMPTMFEFYDNT